uniref:uncharacterized protein LOC120330431 n=1 Tax=Styela clava TaxID=7725 RepID=UPI001939C509|nr:uncharacterized protein LOC120330431 [Styela clava]
MNVAKSEDNICFAQRSESTTSVFEKTFGDSWCSTPQFSSLVEGLKKDIMQMLKNEIKALVEINCRKLMDVEQVTKSQDSQTKVILTDIISSQEYVMNEFKEQECKINKLQKLMDDCQSDINLLKQNISEFQKNEQQYRQTIDEMDQSNRRNLLEIHGYPVMQNENTMVIVKDVAKMAGVEIKPSSIENSYRLKISDKSIYPPIIMVKFFDVNLRDKIFSGRKNIQKQFKNNAGDAWYLSIRENLTKQRRALFKEAKSLVKSNGYKFIWTNNGDILVRKTS